MVGGSLETLNDIMWFIGVLKARLFGLKFFSPKAALDFPLVPKSSC